MRHLKIYMSVIILITLIFTLKLLLIKSNDWDFTIFISECAIISLVQIYLAIILVLSVIKNKFKGWNIKKIIVVLIVVIFASMTTWVFNYAGTKLIIFTFLDLCLNLIIYGILIWSEKKFWYSEQNNKFWSLKLK